MPLGRVLPVLGGVVCHHLSYKAGREKTQIVCISPDVSRSATYRFAMVLLSLIHGLEGIESGGKGVLLKEAALTFINATTGLVPFYIFLFFSSCYNLQLKA